MQAFVVWRVQMSALLIVKMGKETDLELIHSSQRGRNWGFRVQQICFTSSRIQGIGVFAYLNGREFDTVRWRRAIIGCTDLVNCNEEVTLKASSKIRWDVIMANLGLHYNIQKREGNELSRYKGDLQVLFQLLINNAKLQHEVGQESFQKTLHIFLGT